MDKKDYLFIFTITPVQSFIAQARKTRDLYAGSQILSELTKKAIEIAKEYNAEIIMPHIDNYSTIEEIHSIPNRFVAKFKDKNEEELENIGRNIEFNTLFYWRYLAETISKEAKNKFKGSFIKFENYKRDKFIIKFNEHIVKYFNIYWLFYPLEKGYIDDYKKAEKYLGAIKNVRCFEQFETEEDNRKCSICGERDAIVYKKVEIKNEVKTIPAYAYKNSLTFPNSYLIDENEGLCGICYTKRFYVNFWDKKLKEDSFEKDFPSTAKIAILNLYNKKDCKSEDCKNIKEELVNRINEFREKYSIKTASGKKKFFNAQVFFEENLNEKYLKKHGLDDLVDKIPQIKADIEKIRRLAKQINEPFTKYYALIKFDGDNMGKWLSGEFLEDKTQLEKFHEILSQKLRDFADWSKNYIDGNEDNIQKGKTVYAGGDDFLGFINLKYLFEVLERLLKEFKEQVNKPLHQEFKLSNNISFSAGIVIAHYKDPLSLVLDWANKLEEEAKGLPKKNAFGIAVLKRSGEIRKAVYKWDKLQYIKEIYESIVEREEFNSSFITKLEESFSKVPVKNLINIRGRRVFLSELKRVLNRSKNPKLKKEKLKTSIHNLEGNFKSLLESPENIFEILNILKFIERELS